MNQHIVLCIHGIYFPNVANEFCELPHLFSDADIHLTTTVKVNAILFIKIIIF